MNNGERRKNYVRRFFPSTMILLLLLCGVTLLFINVSYSIALFCGLILFFIGVYIEAKITFKGKLNIQTPDGFNQPYHPSALFFPESLNGFKYWMAFTPMPLNAKPYTDRWECPCIVVSNDGINWSYPNNSVTFLDDLSQEQIEEGAFFSDVHLLYNHTDGRFELYYRLSEGEGYYKTITLIRKTLDKKNFLSYQWSERQILTVDMAIKELRPISPSYIKDGMCYRMWFVQGGTIQQRRIHYGESPNGIDWVYKDVCVLTGRVCNPWHIDCQMINSQYYLTIYDQNNEISLWTSANGVEFNYLKCILKPNRRFGSFYNKGLYRACCIFDEQFTFFFSARNQDNTSLGLLRGDTLQELQVISGGRKDSDKMIIKDMFCEFFGVELALYHKTLHK